MFGRASRFLIQPLRTYDARLFDGRGRMVASYRLCCRSKAEARTMLEVRRDVDYARYELWEGMTKIGDGMRPPVTPHSPRV